MFHVPGGGPDQLNRCKEAAAGSVLTCSSNCSFTPWYNTMGFLPPWRCTWVEFWENRWNAEVMYMNDRVSDVYAWQGVIVIYIHIYTYVYTWCIHICWYVMLRIIRHNYWRASVMYINDIVSDVYERQGVIVIYIYKYTYVYVWDIYIYIGTSFFYIRWNWWSASVMYMNDRVSYGYER